MAGSATVVSIESHLIITTKHKPKIVIVGAGLGGLTLALSLAVYPFEIVVLEQASRSAKSAQEQISANGARVLHDLGLEGELAKVVFRPERGEMRHWKTGETLITRPLGESSIERFGFPYYRDRADFHGVLETAARAASRRYPLECESGGRRANGRP